MVTLSPYVLAAALALAGAMGVYEQLRAPIVKVAKEVEVAAQKTASAFESVAKGALYVVTFGKK